MARLRRAHGAPTPAVIDTLHRALLEALKDPGVQEKLAGLGVDIAPDSPDEFAAYIKAEKFRNGQRSSKPPVRRWSEGA